MKSKCKTCKDKTSSCDYAPCGKMKGKVPSTNERYVVMAEVEKLQVFGKDINISSFGDGVVSILPVYADKEKAKKDFPNRQIITIESVLP